MNRFAREATLRPARCLLAALALALACSASPKVKISEPTDVAAAPPLVLSVQAPSGEATPASASGAPQTLQLQVSQIDNPSLQAFSVAVFFVAPLAAPAAPVAVGSVAPYPPDQGSRLTLLVPPAVQAAIAASPTPARFRVLLQPVANDRPLVAPLQITVALLALGPG
jgi:hypothetical protein